MSRRSCALLVALFTAMPAAVCAQGVVIEGVVVDSTRTATSAGGIPTPLAGARIRAQGVGGEAESDAAGGFRLGVPGPGTYELTFHHPRMDSIGIEEMGWTPVTVPEVGAADVDLAIPSWPTLYALWCGRDPEGGEVEAIVAGWVRSTLDDGPLADIPVQLRAPAGGRGLSFAARTDADGLFLFCFVPPGVSYRLVVDAFGLEEADSEVRVGAGEVLERAFEFEVGGEGVLRGVVLRGEDGGPVAEAVVELDGPSTRSALTDGEGRFRVEGLPAGRYILSTRHLAFRDVSREVAIPGGDRVVNVEVRVLPDAVALDPIVVEVEGRRPTFGPLVDVYERMERMRKLGLGRVYDRRQIEESGAMRISHLVSRIVGVRTRPLVGSPNLVIYLNRNRCPPSVYFDGVRNMGGLDTAHPGEVEVVEVYRRMTELPGEFADLNAQRCGAVAVWTRRGR